MKCLPKIISKLLILFFVSTILVACNGQSLIPESWNDPVYFGDSDDLGKRVGGSGTGSEVRNPHSTFKLY